MVVEQSEVGSEEGSGMHDHRQLLFSEWKCIKNGGMYHLS